MTQTVPRIDDAPARTDDAAARAAAHGLVRAGTRPMLGVYTRQLWTRRHFITTFASARLTAQYSQARLGQAWQVMTPLLTAAVYYFVFGVLLGTSRGVPDFVPFLVTGVFIWTFTSQSIGSGARAISGNIGVIRALHFPRAMLPLAVVVQQLQQLLYSLAALFVILVAFGEFPRPSWLLLAPALVFQTVCNLGFAMIFARLGARTQDVATLMPFVLRIWMYLSGVLFSFSRLGAHGRVPHIVLVLLQCNPAAVYIDLARFALIGSVTRAQLPPHIWLLAAGWALVIGAGGFIFFWRAEERYGNG